MATGRQEDRETERRDTDRKGDRDAKRQGRQGDIETER